MTVFKLQVRSLPDGTVAPTWFDDDKLLWDDDRLHKAEPTLAKWQAPRLRLFGRRPTPVLFNPNAFAVSKEVRAALDRFAEIEFLPVRIEGFETYFVMHVVAAVAPPDHCSLRRAPVSKNIVELFSFPSGHAPMTDLFRVMQPQDSAAGRAGFCMSTIYASPVGAQSVMTACQDYLEAVDVTDGPHRH